MKEKAASSFIAAYGRYIVFLVIFILVGYVLLYLTYENVKREMIENLDARQMIHAKQAAKAIESFFDNHIAMLQDLAINRQIIDLDEDGKRTMREFYSLKSPEVSIITRIDSQGRIVHAEPYYPRVIRQTVTKIEDFEEVKRTNQIVVSDVFTNRRGFKTIIVHVPVFKRGEFNGTIALLFPFDLIAKRYIEDIRIGKDGYAMIISKNGIELSCPVPGHVGNSVFDNCRDFPDILAMAKRMIRGEQGVATYLFDRIRENVTSKITKHAVFMPIRLKNNFWSIVVATPQDEVLGALKGFRDRLLLIAAFLAIGIGFFLYMLIKTRIVVKEVERRLKTEEALQESEKKYRHLVESIRDWVWSIDIEGRITFSNEAVKHILGYEVHELLGSSSFYLMHPEDQELSQRLFQQAVEQKRGWKNAVARMIHKDGSVRFFESSAQPIIDAEGRLVGFTGIDRDITERKRAEGALRKSEERLKSIFRAAPIGIGLVSDRVIKQANDRLCEMVGYSRDELLGQSARMVYPTDKEFEYVVRRNMPRSQNLEQGLWKPAGSEKMGE